MTTVERRAEDFVIEASLLADAFGLSQEEIKARMRSGFVTSRCEAGVDEDAGRWRLTFHHGGRACRFIVDTGGNILTRATFPVRTVTQNPGALGAYIGPGAGS
ncbi:DUF6522 family protein [Celeribacter sp.]|uniref:DUF6522 family protein n=1 Tax=Celeribacter sp. TaxID=1890673 RepID=UPI003A8FEAD3